MRVKKLHGEYVKKKRATGGGPPPTPPKYDALMEATASLIGYELVFADQQYDDFCRELPNAPAPAELSTTPAQISFSEPFILNEADIGGSAQRAGHSLQAYIPVEVYDGETRINEASACSTARSDLQATGPSTSDDQSLRRGKKRKPQTEREEADMKVVSLANFWKPPLTGENIDADFEGFEANNFHKLLLHARESNTTIDDVRDWLDEN
ncbi:hypothetical protein Pcinc_021414 [Petrolisthes cinctipes]|uniref:Uncharacterized protein n=1 Tax=Petrolisthes cinctipes TaxID=88211 RepID=A0AAE1FH11_PETCI|nr:hypothetical protein Pcinc_021414 [Petrolisthes cinctipes]